jgi:hypothetical protein
MAARLGGLFDFYKTTKCLSAFVDAGQGFSRRRSQGMAIEVRRRRETVNADSGRMFKVAGEEYRWVIGGGSLIQ